MDLPVEVQRLCGDFENRVIRRPEFLEHCARLVAARVGCSRAGIWIFQGQKPSLRMHCLAMFDGVREQMTQVPDEEGTSVSDYFLALEQTGHVIATDARVHFATAGFFEQWLESNGVKSLLAAAFSVNGQLYGAFTCAHVGSQMEWSRSQLSVLRQIGSRISLALANADRAPTDTQPALLSAPQR
jgi:GAF domain-containing protein